MAILHDQLSAFWSGKHEYHYGRTKDEAVPDFRLRYFPERMQYIVERGVLREYEGRKAGSLQDGPAKLIQSAGM